MILECGRRAIYVAYTVQAFLILVLSALRPSCCKRDEGDGESKDKMFCLSLSPHPSSTLPDDTLAFPCRELLLLLHDALLDMRMLLQPQFFFITFLTWLYERSVTSSGS